MKVLFIRHSLLSRGGDKMITAYASHLAARGHEVTVKANLVDTVFPLHSKVRVEPLPYPGKGGTVLSALLEKQDADVVVADIIPLICLLIPRNRRKVLYFAQGHDDSCYTLGLQKAFIRLLYRIGLSLYRIRTVAVAESLALFLRSRFGAAVTVVQNGIDTSAFYHDPVPGMIAEKGGRISILLLSRSDPSKGFDLGVSVIRNLQSAMPGRFEVWTVGAPAAGYLEGVPHRDLGYLDQSRLREVMSSTDIMLYPSRSEGFPLMVLEAFACRCPVVTTDAVPYASHGANALVSAVGDVDLLTRYVLELMQDTGVRERLAESAYSFAMDHTLDRAAARFEEELQLVGKG